MAPISLISSRFFFLHGGASSGRLGQAGRDPAVPARARAGSSSGQAERRGRALVGRARAGARSRRPGVGGYELRPGGAARASSGGRARALRWGGAAWVERLRRVRAPTDHPQAAGGAFPGGGIPSSHGLRWWRAGATAQRPSRDSRLHPQEEGPKGGIGGE